MRSLAILWFGASVLVALVLLLASVVGVIWSRTGRGRREHKQAFAEIREELQSVNNNAVYAAGFAVLGRRDNDVTGERVTKLEARVQRIEEKLDG